MTDFVHPLREAVSDAFFLSLSLSFAVGHGDFSSLAVGHVDSLSLAISRSLPPCSLYVQRLKN